MLSTFINLPFTTKTFFYLFISVRLRQVLLHILIHVHIITTSLVTLTAATKVSGQTGVLSHASLALHRSWTRY